MQLFNRFIFIMIAMLNTCIYSFAQQSTLQITVKNTDDLPLPGAPVQLINPEDSSSVYAVTDVNGIAVFNDFKNGIYILSITYIGFKSIETSLKVTDDLRYFEFLMSTDAISLGGVTITGKRPFIRQEGDKMIIDPEPLANTSTNILEILETTPGLFVDQDGGIFLTSATPATIYINGREQKMSNQDINTILRSLPPNSVERIEVIRTPSAKHDASSAGGIINIVLKKGVKIGRFGSVNAGMNQGIYGNRFLGFSFNNSGDKTTKYVNFNVGLNGRFEEINSLRFLHPDTSLSQSAGSIITSNQLFTGYGINFNKNENLSISYDGRINASLRNSLSENDNIIFDKFQTSLSEIHNEVNNHTRFISIQQDFGLLKKLDTLGSVFDVKLSYSLNSNAINQNYTTFFALPLEFEYSGRGDNTQLRHFVVFQSDLTYKLPWSVKLETGIKSSWQNFKSNSDFFYMLNDDEIVDAQRTNAFQYIENINSAYLQASRKLIAGFLLKAGTRMEHTNMQGFQTIPKDTGFVVNRVDLFPYVFLSRKIIEMMGVELFAYLIYRKTILRPGYHNLNPYVRFIDQFLYETGNPSLKPQFTENLEMNISFNDMPVFAVGRNYTKDIFSMVMYNDEIQEGVLMRTYDNLGKSTETYLRGIVGIPPGGKYFFAIGAQYNLIEHDGFYQNEPLNFVNGSWRYFTFHSLNLFKETKLTVSGFLMKNGQWNFYELETFGQLNVGLSQTLLDRKLTITLSARDILKSMITKFEFNQGSIYSYGDRYTDNRRFGINIRYNFGLNKKEERKGLPGFEDTDVSM